MNRNWVMKRITGDRTVPPEKRYRVRELVEDVEIGELFFVEAISARWCSVTFTLFGATVRFVV